MAINTIEEMKKIQIADIRLLFEIVGVVSIVANLWLFTQLAPIVQSVALIDQRVSAVEAIKLSDQVTTNKANIENLQESIDRVERRVDALK